MRYKQTVLGAAWAVIQLLAILVVFTVFFGMVLLRVVGTVLAPRLFLRERSARLA